MTEVGDLIADRYRVVAQVGSGSMGIVWRATDELLRRDVAVKELLLQPGIGPEQAEEAKQRAAREGRITARLHHPNAISVYDVAEHDGRPCLIMEYVPSASLADRLAAQRSLPVEDVAHIGRQIAAALAAAHRAGIVHRDVKPGNVLLTEDGTAKLTDFGISRAAGDGTVTATGVLAGTPAYLAPEVVRGQDADFRSDVYSLGATLYAAVEGAPPFGVNDNPIALLHRIATENVTPPQHAGALTPALNWMLSPDPADRPAMGQAQAALTMAMDDPRPLPRATAAAGAGGRVRSRHRTIGSLIVAAAVVAVAIVLGQLHHGGGNTPQRTAGGATTTSRSAGPTTTAGPTSTTPGPTTTTTTTTTTTATKTTTTTPPAGVADQLRSTIVGYYRQVPGDLDAAWPTMTADYQQNHAGGRSGYQRFWAKIDHVTLTGVSAQPPHTVIATIHYFYDDGHVEVEKTSFGLVQQAGQWKIASSSVLTHHST